MQHLNAQVTEGNLGDELKALLETLYVLDHFLFTCCAGNGEGECIGVWDVNVLGAGAGGWAHPGWEEAVCHVLTVPMSMSSDYVTLDMNARHC